MQLQYHFSIKQKEPIQNLIIFDFETHKFSFLCNKLLLSLYTFQNKTFLWHYLKCNLSTYAHDGGKVMMFQLDLLLFFNY